MVSAAASAAVRRAPRQLCTRTTTIRSGAPRRNANGEGAVGSARGGRAPRFQVNRSGYAAWEYDWISRI
ncbi:MAG: hypothetical protein DME22_07320 [Verrucomicrobia bacterium]|nr:MAG: hypothetical protein DME22_07320 [Verrucomicrobiota bacterium]PYJ93209.1 MAG: hypothetical protein DME23_26430 [Verrucomicrobiota bacterium]